MEISVCLIVKNEERVLERCLKCAKQFADEIVVVDTGSIDKTLEIARKYASILKQFDWCNDFSKARNFSFSLATKEYICWLDADDIILEEDIKKINALKNRKNLADVYMLKYQFVDEFDNPTFVYFRERIVKNNKNYVWQDPIHEYLKIDGNIEYENISITHKPEKFKEAGRNLSIYREYSKTHTLNARQKFYFARELYFNGLFLEAIEVFNNFLEDKTGWSENKINACLILAECYKAENKWEMVIISLLRSFEYGIPQAEVLCKIGDYFLLQHKIKEAIYWYECASKKKTNLKSGAFVEPKYYTTYPCLQLCVCHFKLGNLKKAEFYNNKVLKFDKNNKSAQYNTQFFKNS